MQALKKVENDAKNKALTVIIEAVCGVNKRCPSASTSVAGNGVSRSGAGVVVGTDDALYKSGSGVHDGGFECAVCDITEAPRGGGTQLRFEVNIVAGVGVETSEEAIVAFVREVGLRVSSAWSTVCVGLLGS